MNTVLLANQLVREANMLSEALHKDTLFRVTLTVSPSPSGRHGYHAHAHFLDPQVVSEPPTVPELRGDAHKQRDSH